MKKVIKNKKVNLDKASGGIFDDARSAYGQIQKKWGTGVAMVAASTLAAGAAVENFKNGVTAAGQALGLVEKK